MTDLLNGEEMVLTMYKHTDQRYTQQSIIKYMMLGKIKEERVDDNEPVPQCIIFPGGQVI